MKRAFVSSLVLIAVVAATRPARAGHEMSFYPSFYPQEIRISTVAPAAAAGRLQTGSLHAYVGGDPFAGGTPPPSVAGTESLASYLVLTWREGRPAERERRCATAAALVRALGGAAEGYVVHPYAVTPFHGDYLQHADLVAAEARAARASPAAPVPAVTVKATGALGIRLAALGWQVRDADADATLEDVPLAGLLAPRSVAFDGRLGPPWLRDGWFHAYLLQAPALEDPGVRRTVEDLYRRLTTGGDGDPAARLNLERRLVLALASGCERAVIGYAVRHEYTSADYSEGVENVGADAFDGLGSHLFVRTVKLKDFPWNGWLRVGTAAPPTAAWNPFGGFTDPTGRLVWAAVGDPALLPAPRDDEWLPNRVTPASITAGPVEIPADAVTPRPEGLVRVGTGKQAAARLVYRVRASAFHDGTRMTPADLLYALAFAARWSARAGTPEYDRAVARATALERDWLAAVRVVRVETETRKVSDVELVYQVPIVEVYLSHRLGDERQLAAVAPPWTTVPWHLVAAMEEAVRLGAGAFSRQEAERRGVEWLDLVRSPKARKALAALVDRFAREGFVPAALRGLVTPKEARERWAALRRFSRARGHFLVTNGPYRLSRWSPDEVRLEVFRDFTYPIGVGDFDEYAIPLRAHPTLVEQHGGRLEVKAEAEAISRFQRSYEIVRQPLPRHPQPGEEHRLPVCRWVVVGADGQVVRAGRGTFRDGRFEVDPGPSLAPGDYTVLVALYQQDNAVDVEVKAVPYRLGRP